MNPLTPYVLKGLIILGLVVGLFGYGYHTGDRHAKTEAMAAQYKVAQQTAQILATKQAEKDKVDKQNATLSSQLDQIAMEKQNEIDKLQSSNASLAKQLSWLWKPTSTTASSNTVPGETNPTSTSPDYSTLDQYATEITGFAIEVSEEAAKLENYSNVCHQWALGISK